MSRILSLRRLAAACLLIAVSAATQHSVPAFAQLSAAQRDRLEAPIRSRLSRPLSRPLRNVTLLQLEQQLRREGLPALLERRALEEIGIDPRQARVTFELPGVPVSHALRRMLQPHEMSWIVRDSTLMLTSQDEAESLGVHRTFDVSGILVWEKIRVGGYFGAPAEMEGYDYDSLIEMITSTIGPDSWDEVGGPGTIEPLTIRSRPLLVVSNSEEVLEEVAQLLERLRLLGRQRPGAIRRARAGVPRARLRSSSLPRTRLQEDDFPPAAGMF